MDNGDRVMAVYVASVIVNQLLTPSADPKWLRKSVSCIEGLPAGAELIDATYDQWTDCVRLIFRHDSFEAVNNIRKIPVLQVTFKSTYESSGGAIAFNETLEVK